MGREYSSTGIKLLNSAGNSTLDSVGIVSSTGFSISSSIQANLNQSIAGTSVITGGTLTLINTRSTTALLNLKTDAFLVESVGNTAHAQIIIEEAVGAGTNVHQRIFLHSGNTSMRTSSCHYVNSFSAGTHNFVLRGFLENITGAPSLTVYAYYFSYIQLGT